MRKHYFCGMKMIDTHTHLYVEADEDREAAIAAAMAEGVTNFYLPAIDSQYTQRMLELEKAYPENIRLMMRLHQPMLKKMLQKSWPMLKNNLLNIDIMPLVKLG